MTLKEKRVLFTKNIARLITFVNFNLADKGYECAIDYCKRLKYEQDILVGNGLSKTHNSKHLEGLAADIIMYIHGVYQEDTSAYKILGDYWKSLDKNNVWGGDWKDFKDGNHFQYEK